MINHSHIKIYLKLLEWKWQITLKIKVFLTVIIHIQSTYNKFWATYRCDIEEVPFTEDAHIEEQSLKKYKQKRSYIKTVQLKKNKYKKVKKIKKKKFEQDKFRRRLKEKHRKSEENRKVDIKE